MASDCVKVTSPTVDSSSRWCLATYGCSCARVAWVPQHWIDEASTIQLGLHMWFLIVSIVETWTVWPELWNRCTGDPGRKSVRWDIQFRQRFMRRTSKPKMPACKVDLQQTLVNCYAVSNCFAQYHCSHLANTIAIRHVVVGAECRFCLDPALVLAGCCGQDFVDYNLYLPLSF